MEIDRVHSKKIKQILIYSVLGAFVLKFIFSISFYSSDTYKGRGFSVKKPVGWEMGKRKEQPDIGVFYQSQYDPDIVNFKSPEKTKTLEPLAQIMAVSTKLPAPSWIEDMWPDILKAVSRDFVIIDRGEIKVDGQISKWVFYQAKDKSYVCIEFYITDEGNGFYKIRYVAAPKVFKTYRPVFEAFKDSFRFSFGF